MKVLVADDDELSLMVAKSVLARMGHEVIEAQDGEEAWTMFDSSPVRIVISDWMMPKVDGIELCRKIRRRPATAYAYFIMLTGMKTGRENYRIAMEAGVDDFLLKPVDGEELAIRLNVAQRIMGLEAQVRRLEGIIPVCAYCKRVRRDDDVYQQMEAYIQEHSLAVFSHGICPACMEKVGPQG